MEVFFCFLYFINIKFMVQFSLRYKGEIMRKYVLKRMILALVTVFIILSATYLLMKLLPFQVPMGFADDVNRYFTDQVNLGYVLRFETEQPQLGDYLWTSKGTSIGYEVYYYKRPIFEQYFSWLGNIFTSWDWGRSTQIEFNVNAMTIIASKIPVTISINIISVLISVPAGIALGIWAALKKNKPTDHIISTLIMVFISVPSFIIISLMIKFFVYDLNWLPWQWPDATSDGTSKFLGYIIPVLSLSFGSICGYCRFTRAELCEVMSSDYLLLARTKGLTRNQCIVRHALRNAMVPIVPSILAEFIGILSGSMILENLYNIPGIGNLFVSAINFRDYNVLMVDMAMFTTISLMAGVLLDISYGFIDPRIRMGAKKNG